MKKILIIAAHPDDDVLGCGGLISKFSSQGSEIRVVFLGEGSSSRYDDREAQAELVNRDLQARKRSAMKAFELLKIQSHVFYDNPCGKFDQVPLLSLGKLIEKEIKCFQPDAVFTHWSHDVNNDHQVTFQATLQATRPGAMNHVAKLYCYEVLSSTEWRFTDTFQPNFFVELSQEQIKLKIRALQAYESEVRPFPFPRCQEGVLTLARMRGMQSHFEYAEAFQLVREFCR